MKKVKKIKIKINGRVKLVNHNFKLETLISKLNIPIKKVAIELNNVILDKKTPGPDQSVSIDFMDLKNLVDGIRKIELSLGNNKSVHSKEKQIREWAFRSIVTTSKIKAGDIFSEENLWTKRPGTGIPSAKLPDILGKIAKNNI